MSPSDQAKAYQRKKQQLGLFRLVFTPCLLLGLLLTPLTFLFRDAAQAASAGPYMTVALYFLFFSLFWLLFDLPLMYYSGFHLEHRFGLSNHTLKSWLSDLIKQSVLSFLIALVLILGLYGLMRAFPVRWWLWAWAGYALFNYVVGKIFPVWIVPLFYKYSPIPDASLKARIVAFAAGFGLPVENVYALNLSRTTKKANAAFMGIGKTKRVVLSDTLLDRFTGDEIEMVLAHELGHFKHRDIWRQIAFGLVLSFATFRLVFGLLPVLSDRMGFAGVTDPAAMPLLFLIGYLFGVVLTPLQNAFSRHLERQADRFALDQGAHRESFISCMRKLGQVNLADPDPHPLYEWFFYSHPSIKKRLAMAGEKSA